MSIVCVDIGGTSIKLALADHNGVLLEETDLQTLSHLGTEDVIERLCLAISGLLVLAGKHGNPARAIGLACPGVIDRDGKIVMYSPNLNWHNVRLVDTLEARLGLPVFMENDANLYALGEYAFGVGQGRHDLICFTLGTGVGGGIIHQGRIFNGPEGWGAELGHTIVEPGGRQCGCGACGCLEAYASATGLQGMLRDLLAQGACQTGLMPGDGVKAMDMAAHNGDPLAKEIFSRAGRYLGLGIINVVLATGIKNIVLGGGVAKGWDLMSQATWQQLQIYLKIINWQEVNIELSRLKENAPLLGAAALVHWHLERMD